MSPPVSYLRERLHYEATTGALFWKQHPDLPKAWNTRYAQREAFTTVNRGYRQGRLDDRLVLAHRAAWALATGAWPADQIDHINGDRSDNRLANLREASNQTNHRNQKIPSHNNSGAIGVHWRADANKWRAVIKVDGKNHYLGYFSTLPEATAARKKAERYFDFHPNHGRSACALT